VSGSLSFTIDMYLVVATRTCITYDQQDHYTVPMLPVEPQSTDWQWCGVNEYPGTSAVQPMRRCGLTIVSLPLNSKARISGRPRDLKNGSPRYACC